MQCSATSQAPFCARHTVVFGANASAGQSAALPVQNSGESQPPVDARHCVVEGMKGIAPPTASTSTNAPYGDFSWIVT